MPKIRFTKMHGGGNDFIVIDAVTQKVSTQQLSAVAMRLADRQLGIGCDQILILRKVEGFSAHFQYEIINADGSIVGQCGNGARCAHVFLRRQELTNKRKLLLHTSSTTIMTESAGGNKVRAHLAVPKFASSAVPMNIRNNGGDRYPQRHYIARVAVEIDSRFAEDIKWDGLPPKFGAVSLGNPHVVFPFPSTSRHQGLEFNDKKIGSYLRKLGKLLNRKCKSFPQGVNVGFCQWNDDDQKLYVRVYERGVGETPSCGSGAAAAALMWQYFNEEHKPVQVCMLGEELICDWPRTEIMRKAVWIEGGTNFVFDGKFSL